jgi:hypothetical protein
MCKANLDQLLNILPEEPHSPAIHADITESDIYYSSPLKIRKGTLAEKEEGNFLNDQCLVTFLSLLNYSLIRIGSSEARLAHLSRMEAVTRMKFVI